MTPEEKEALKDKDPKDMTDDEKKLSDALDECEEEEEKEKEKEDGKGEDGECKLPEGLSDKTKDRLDQMKDIFEKYGDKRCPGEEKVAKWLEDL